MQICCVSPQEQIAEDAIRGALARGEQNSEALRERKGKPIDLDAYFNTPPELRMAFSMLKGGEIVPEELELLKEITSSGSSAARARTDSRALSQSGVKYIGGPCISGVCIIAA